jgi:Flp pilus assembly protein TadG
MKIIFKPGKQRGVVAVEMALILPVMLILVFGITELGRALYQYNSLVKATRGAVRYLAQQDLANLSASTTPTLSEVYDRTKALAVCGASPCSDAIASERFPGLKAAEAIAKVSLCDYVTPSCFLTHRGVQTGQGQGLGTVDLVTVTIGGAGDKAFSFKSMMSYVIPDIAFSPIKTTMVSRYF